MKNIRIKNYLFLSFLIILFLITFSSISFSDSSFRKGFPAPIFSLKDIEGETFNLEDYKEKQKLLILYFCNDENKDSVSGIEEFAKYFEDYVIEEKYHIILINTLKDFKEEDTKIIKEFWQNKGIDFSILIDPQKEVGNLYDIKMIPTTILLDKNLVVKRIYPGLISKQQKLMFQYMSYFLGAEKKVSQKKEKKDSDSCSDGVCPPPPGY